MPRLRRSFLVALVLLLAVAPGAAAQGPLASAAASAICRNQGGVKVCGGGTGARSQRGPGTDAPATQAPTTLAPGDGASAPSIGGQPDPITTLGLKGPLCSMSGLSVQALRNCRASGRVESAYPLSDYGFDINIEDGVTHPYGTAMKVLHSAVNAVWMAFLYVLAGALAILQWAFSLDVFGDNQAMAHTNAVLLRMYRAVDEPWLLSLMGAIGLWGIWTGLLRRQPAQMFGGIALSVGLIVLAMWIVHAPQATVGEAAQISNGAALALVAAPTGKPPASGFADAMASTFDQIAIRPWCALEFGDVAWCLARPERAAVTAAQAKERYDAAFVLPQIAALRRQGVSGAALLQRLEAIGKSSASGPPPATRAGLYLQYSLDSPPRKTLWDYYHGTDSTHVGPLDTGLGGTTGKAPDKVAIQDTGGLMTRIALFFLLAVGLLGALCLLVWLALKLIFQATTGFILLLAAPIALLFPAFGESGRRSFALWGQTLLGTVLAKAIYAGFLAIALAGVQVLGNLQSARGWAIAFALQSAFWWAAFLKRNQILSFVSVGPPGDAGSNLLRFGGAYMAYRLGRDVMQGHNRRAQARTTRREMQASELAQTRQRHEDAHAEATRATADEELGRRVEALGASEHEAASESATRYERARRRERDLEQHPTIRSFKERRETARAAGHAYTPNPQERALLRELRGARDERKALEPEGQAAQQRLRQHADNVRTLGSPHSETERGALRERIRTQLALAPEDEAHAWRVGRTPAQFRQLQGPRRERAIGEIARQLEVDRRLFGAVPSDGASALPEQVEQARVVLAEQGHNVDLDARYRERLHKLEHSGPRERSVRRR